MTCRSDNWPEPHWGPAVTIDRTLWNSIRELVTRELHDRNFLVTHHPDIGDGGRIVIYYKPSKQRITIKRPWLPSLACSLHELELKARTDIQTAFATLIRNHVRPAV